jgi:hypothetical protein
VPACFFRIAALQLQESQKPMQSLFEWLYAQPHLLTISQIALDLALIVLVLVFFMRRPKSIVIPGREELLASFDRIIQETKEIADVFDTNLQERQALIQQVLVQLDARLEEARSTVEQLQTVQSALAQTTPQDVPNRNADQQEILRLARQGLDADSIAQRTRKPRGEVELILKLHRMSKR